MQDLDKTEKMKAVSIILLFTFAGPLYAILCYVFNVA